MLGKAVEGFPTCEEQEVGCSSMWEQKPRFWSLEGMGDRTRVESRYSETLTFADDPVENGLQLLDTDLQVLGEEEGWHLSCRKAAARCPRGPPPPRPNLPLLPVV